MEEDEKEVEEEEDGVEEDEQENEDEGSSQSLLEQSMIYQCDGAASICLSAESEEEVADYENKGESEEEGEYGENEDGNSFEASDIESLAEYEAEQTNNDDLDEQSQGDLSDEDDEHNIPVHINQNRLPRIIKERTRKLRFVQTISKKNRGKFMSSNYCTDKFLFSIGKTEQCKN